MLNYYTYSILFVTLYTLIHLNHGVPVTNLVEIDDMLFPVSRRNGLRDLTYRWPNRTLVYTIDPTFSASDVIEIKAAMNEIASKTCIKFLQRTTEISYVSIYNDAAGSGGCTSYVGKIHSYYQPQKLNLAPGCIWLGIIAHELLHAIGFEHEHERPDRDEFVNIYEENMISGYAYAFAKESETRVSTFGMPYDFGSVMHYGPFSFSSNGKPTILPKEPYTDEEIGQRFGLSQLDAIKVNRMYECSVAALINNELD